MRPGAKHFVLSVAWIAIVLTGACSKKPAVTAVSQPGQEATVTLNDGSGFAGAVTASSTASITLKAANGETRTYPMSEVASVQYGTAATTSPMAAAPLSAVPVAVSPADANASANANAPAAAGGNLPASGLTPASQPPAPNATPPAPVSLVRTVPAGARLVVRNNESIDSKTATPGQTYSAVVERNVLDTGGRVVIPHGSPATLVVRSATGQGKIQGQSELALDIDAVSIAGRRYRVETANIVKKGTAGFGENKRTGVFLGGGTALGALLGAVAGGGRGAAIGALSGAAAGTATQAVTRGHGVRVPAETLMTFRLEAPVHVREVR